jgi:phage-related protein
MKTLRLPVLKAKNAIADANATVMLFAATLDRETDTVVHLTDNNEDVVFAGQRYQAYDVRLELIGSDSEGGLTETRLVASNVPRDWGYYLEQGGVVDCPLVVRAVHAAHLDDGDEMASVTYNVKSVDVTDLQAVLTLGLPDPLDLRAPAQRFDEMHCRHVYRGQFCGYTGALTSCTKRLEGVGGCREHDNAERFGGFQGLLRERG